MKLTEHFTLEELTASNKAVALKIDNTPSPVIQQNLLRLAMLLESIRSAVGKPLKVSSAYRCPALNKAVGGASGSFHTRGLACDFSVVGYTPFELCVLIEKSGVSYDKLILEFDRWVHIQIQDNVKNNRQQSFTIRDGTGYLYGIIQKP